MTGAELPRHINTWYIPHHGVYNPNKPGKLNSVLDCATTHDGVSLNSALLSGQDLTNRLLGVLLLFRQEHVAVTADIEVISRQVNVSREDCDRLRIYWWLNGVSRAPEVYRMVVH